MRRKSRGAGLMSLRESKNGVDRAGHALILLLLLRELLSSGRRDRVVPSPPIILRLPPLCPNGAVEQQSLERGIKRALAHLEHILRNLAQALRNAVAVQRVVAQRAKNQKIESAGQQLERADGTRHRTIPIDGR